MFIVYIAFGIASGIVAATMTLLAGSGLFMAFLAYIVGGLAGVTASLLWMLFPLRGGPAQQPVTQRARAQLDT